MWLIDDRRTSLRSLSGSDRDPLEPPLSKAGAGDRPAVAGQQADTGRIEAGGNSVLAAGRISGLMRASRLSATSSLVIASVMKSLPYSPATSAARASS